MIQGFTLRPVYESSLTFYHDDGMTQLADDPTFDDINVGVGDSAAPIMFQMRTLLLVIRQTQTTDTGGDGDVFGYDSTPLYLQM